MKNISKYHLAIISAYILLIFLVANFKPEVLNYNVSVGSLAVVALLFAVSVYGLSYFRYIKYSKISLSIFFYTLIFAVPEEILFRGLIQSYLLEIFASTGVAVLLSALIFGLAHLPNGAKGASPRKWNWNFFALTFPGGLVLGAAYALTGSLFASTVLHVLFLIFIKCFSEFKEGWYIPAVASNK
jgi:membrane protease YdiL (CAAX protease family)